MKTAGYLLWGILLSPTLKQHFGEATLEAQTEVFFANIV